MACTDCWPLHMVISGGQTGADEAGLRAAKALGYQTGGMMPHGWKTEAGPRPEFKDLYGMVESRFAGYEHRTRHNVRAADGTVIFGDLGEAGSSLTRSMCEAIGKPNLHIGRLSLQTLVPVDIIRGWILHERIRILNAAGNRESKSPGIGRAVEQILLEALHR